MKRLLSAAVCLLLLIAAAGCGSPSGLSSAKVNIVATVFPLYDWVRELTAGADGVEVTLLLDNGVDLHSYQPTADDILKISTCDLFVFVGGESDDWVEDALKESVNKNMETADLLALLGENAKAEEHVEGMEEELEEEEHGEEDAHEEDEEPEIDEHVWLSLKNAAFFCRQLTNRLEKLDSQNASLYRANRDAYLEKLDELDERYHAAAETAKMKTLIFADRFPFRYLTDDYGLSYYAAFAGCSAESEAKFETVIFLAKKVDELGTGCVLQLESSDGSLARTVVRNTAAKNQKILTLNSLQSATAEDAKSGVTYLSLMEANLEVLKEALAG